MELDKVREALDQGATATEHRETVTFPNGRGVSIIRHRGSYGYSAGLFELAVLNSSGDLDYSTPVTGDVLGWQSVEEVLEAMKQVAGLPTEQAAIEGLVLRGELAE